MAETLQSLGESELLRRLARFAPPGQFDDDTATLAAQEQAHLVNTDLLVDGVHFSDTTTAAQDVGWRAAAVNLSDLAASGVDAVLGVTVGLVAPADTPWSWVEGVYQGLDAALKRYGGVLLGGDCSRGCQRMLSVTAIGSLGPLRLLRSAARPGDQIVVSGCHGLSRLGLGLLQNDPALSSLNLSRDLCEQAIHRHRRPTPRLDALQALIRCKPDGLPWRAGGTDSSDGLLRAVELLSATSRCGIRLTRDRLPQASSWPVTPLFDDWCLNGGEDFELVLSLPEAWAESWLASVPGSCWIGDVVADPPGVRWADSHVPVTAGPGFNHFQP